jgi:hypothetical protein
MRRVRRGWSLPSKPPSCTGQKGNARLRTSFRLSGQDATIVRRSDSERETQPPTQTAQRAEKTNPTISIMGRPFNHALIRAVAKSQANCNAVKLTPKKAKPTISKPVMDSPLKVSSPQNRGNSLSAMCRASQNCSGSQWMERQRVRRERLGDGTLG